MSLPRIYWVPSPNYSSRGGNRVRLIVPHDCEGNYRGSIDWFAHAQSRVSAHLVLKEDGTEATQMVAWGNKAWHACNFNPFSEGIEAAGYAAKGFDAPELDALAALVDWRLRANGLPCQEATAENDWTGFTEHAKLGAAGGGHHDFTEDPAVWAAFVRRVQAAHGKVAPPEPPRPTEGGRLPPASPGYTPSGTIRHDLAVGSLEWAQAQLNARGMAHPILIVDGIEGPATERAIVMFQRYHGLSADGVLGQKTIDALKAA